MKKISGLEIVKMTDGTHGILDHNLQDIIFESNSAEGCQDFLLFLLFIAA